MSDSNHPHDLMIAVGRSAAEILGSGVSGMRVLVRYAHGLPKLDDRWRPVILLDGRTAWARKSDCGIVSCRCGCQITLDAPKEEQ